MAIQMKSRQWMLRARFVGAILYSSYFYLKEAHAGFLGSMTNCIGAFVQIVVPEKYAQKTFKIRFGIALILASFGLYMFAGTSGVLPMIAVMVVRFSEIQSCVQRIRFGLLISQCCWLIYSIDLMILPFIMTEIILISSNLWATWKFYRLRPLKVTA
jgi:hypothetical protein